MQWKMTFVLSFSVRYAGRTNYSSSVAFSSVGVAFGLKAMAYPWSRQPALSLMHAPNTGTLSVTDSAVCSSPHQFHIEPLINTKNDALWLSCSDCGTFMLLI
jgi:hypothetical protein